VRITSEKKTLKGMAVEKLKKEKDYFSKHFC
jgi:hypothetical protein